VIGQSGHADAEAARRCIRGALIADEVSTGARELVVAWLHAEGLTDVQIAQRCCMSTYTTSRIRARLGLAVHRVPVSVLGVRST
jgi:DNA-binding NarL/FixJ family response regulator